MNTTTKTTTLLALLIVLVIAAGLLLSLSTIARQQRILSIGSFEDCALAGYPIMESSPEQCRTPDGRTFVNSKQVSTSTDVLAPAAPQPRDCVIGGCSSQLCGERGDDLISTCIYKAEYACYKQFSACERQADGKCDWTPTPQLSRCIANPPATSAPSTVY
ncbi:MAG: hypothetical protein JWM46_659 [Candidatus Kaiserbacteria bacterium]|nr:hypothetical protein [Candidatus Kaiserbacteria bacterium]